MYRLQTIELEKKLREEEAKFPPVNSIKRMEDDLISIGKGSMVEDLPAFFKNISQYEYKHPGLSRDAYMCHPVRVARLVISYSESFGIETIKLALSHNILEVADVDESSVIADDLKALLPTITALTVNRAQQWDSAYKRNYYGGFSDDREAATVKVLDKLDNLYILSNNPNRKIKELYLDEIEHHVIALARRYVPKVVQIINELVSYNRKILEVGEGNEV